MKEVCRRKKDGLFDVTLRMYHGTETCELVGTFLKYMIDTTSVCIATTVFKNKSSTQCERIKKRLQKIFKDFGFETVAESNLSILNYLNVTLNVNHGSFKPCQKPDDITHLITSLIVVNIDCNQQFSMRVKKITSRIGVSWTHSLPFCI